MTVDVHYFDSWEQRIAEPPKRHKFCYCGHVVGSHFAQQTAEPGLHGGITIRYGEFRCYALGCFCAHWRWDKRLWSKVKRKVGKRR